MTRTGGGAGAGPVALGTRMVQGVALELGGTALLRLLSLARLVVLARLFVPEEYGGYSTGLIVVGLALLLLGGGVQAYVVKAPEANLPRTFWTALVLASGVGGVLGLLVVLSGPLLARTLGDPQLTLVLAILAFSVLESAVTLPLTLLDRRLRFGLAKAVEALGLVCGIAVTVGMDLAEVTPVYAMAAGHTTSVVLRGVALWLVARPLPPFAFSRAELRSQVRFTAPLMGAGAFAFVGGRGDDLGVRVLWGNESLGLYSVAFYAPALLREVIVAIDRVTLPILVHLSKKELRHAFANATRLLAVVSVPAGFALAAFSRPLTLLALGERWLAAAPLMTLIGIAFGVKGCLGLNWGSLAYLSDSTRTLARVAVVNAGLTIGVALPLIAWLGPVGGAWYALADAVVFGPIQRFPLIRKVLGDLSFLRAAARPIAAAAVFSLLAFLLGSQQASATVGLLGFLAVVAASVMAVAMTDPELRRMLREASRKANGGAVGADARERRPHGAAEPAPNHPRGIAVLGAYGTGNMGDELVLGSLIRLLRHAYPGVEIKAFAEVPTLTASMHHIEVVPLEPYRPARSALSALRRGDLARVGRGVGARLGTDELLEWADLLVVGGGNLLTDYPTYFLEHYFGQIAGRAVRRGVPLAVLGVGASPVNTGQGWRLLERVAREWATALVVREQEAADLLARVGARDVEVTGDPVLLSPPPGLVAGAHPDGPIGLNLRPTIAEGSAPLFAEELVASLARVGSVLPIALHAGPDVPVLRRALPGVEVFAPADPDALVRQLSGCGALVSMRLHALILGATLGMPSVGLSYHPKVERFARSVGTFQALDCVALPPGRVADEVVRLLAEQRQGDAAERRARVGALRARGLEAFRRALTRLPFAPPCA